jgi:predicted metalloprotease
MLWKNRRESSNLTDVRGKGGPLGVVGLVLGAVIYYFMGGNPADYVSQNMSSVQKQQSSSSDEQKRFIAVVLADTEDVWNEIFSENGQRYQEPKLVVFSHQVQSACGRASSAIGPFYCPGDQQVYLDLGFFNQLSDNLGAGGDFAAAYVVAHEVGHHVQTLLGITKPSVAMELQADCLAGVWAKRTQEAKNVIEEGDIAEAMNAAAAVGDDRLQKASGGEVMPDSFTHGSSAQRVEAFKTGFEKGSPRDCQENYKA